MSNRGARVQVPALAPWKRMLPALLLPVAICLFASGCIHVKDTLALNPDGSGSVEIETACYVPGVAQMRSMGYGGGTHVELYPPLSKRDADLLFPPADFTATVDVKKGPQGESVTVVKASFKDVNRLLASPYADAHSLWMGVDADGKTLTVKALSGLQALPDLDSLQGERDLPRNMMKQMKDNADKLRVDFALTLPAPVKADSAVVDANSATWTVDHAVIKEGPKLCEALKAVMIAACSARDLHFKPVSPPRLALSTFAELAPGPLSEKPAPVDSARVLASAKFFPLRFQSTRTFYFADESVNNNDSASLFGLVVIPRDLAPQRWAKVKLDKVSDDTGADLLPPADRQSWGGRDYGYFNDPRYSPGAKPAPQVTHLVDISMQPPKPDAKALKHLEASIDLNYPGVLNVVKLKDAVAVKYPPETPKVAGPAAKRAAETPIEVTEDQEDARKPIDNPRLKEFGLNIELDRVSYNGGTVQLTITASGDKALLTGVQAYDAKGNAWPTIFASGGMGGDRQYYSVAVVGRPQGPLSLALIVDGGGPSVKIPIVLDSVPVAPNESKQAPKPAPEPDDDDF